MAGPTIKDLAYRTLAAAIGGPVDITSMVMRPFGYSVDKPMLGSEWIGQKLQDQGVISDARDPLKEFLASILFPMGAVKAGPAIFKAEQAAARNAMIPAKMNKQAGAILFHGSNDSMPIREINSGGVFGGLFASGSERSAASHGDSLYRMTVPDSSIMNVGEDLPWDQVKSVIGKNIRSDSPHADEIADMVVNARSAFDSSIPEDELMHALRASDLGEADWELQRLRGLLAKNAGFKAVQMPDEHGMSYLVLPGTTVRPANASAKSLFKQK